MTSLKENKLVPMPYKRNNDSIRYENALIHQLEKHWKNNEVNTMLDVICYCVGRYGKVDSVILEAIEYLLEDQYIKS